MIKLYIQDWNIYCQSEQKSILKSTCEQLFQKIHNDENFDQS